MKRSTALRKSDRSQGENTLSAFGSASSQPLTTTTLIRINLLERATRLVSTEAAFLAQCTTLQKMAHVTVTGFKGAKTEAIKRL